VSALIPKNPQNFMPASKTTPAAPDKVAPICIVESDASHLALAVDFALRDGRVHGFPYAHLLSYLAEKNPEAALHSDAPPDRFSLWFSTHDVTLIGWRLSGLAPLLRQGKLASVMAVDARYYELSTGPFVAEIRVKLAQATD
jgi:hypothetical protein